MEPVTMVVICATVFGVVGILATFIRQLLLSRDKQLNDRAQEKALAQEVKELERLRQQMANNKRFDSHYQVLGANKDAIQYLDQQIEDVLKKKEQLIQRYAQVALKESSAIIAGEQLPERQELCARLKEEIDSEIVFYEKELEQWQKRRALLWDSHNDLQDYLLEQERQRNKNLDQVYAHHSDLLEKIYLRHLHNNETITKQTMEANSQGFRSALSAPLEFLLGFFRLSTGVDPDQARRESDGRGDVSDAESDINEPGDAADDGIEDEDLPEDDGISDDESAEDYRRNKKRSELAT